MQLSDMVCILEMFAVPTTKINIEIFALVIVVVLRRLWKVP